MAGYAKINVRTHIHRRGRRIQYGASRASLRVCAYYTLINARDCRVCARWFVSVCARGVRACNRRCPCVVFPPILLRFRTPIGPPIPTSAHDSFVATRPPPPVCINVPQSVTLVHSHTRKHPSRHYVPHSAVHNRRRPPPTTTLQLNHRGPRAPPPKRQSRTRPPPTTRPSGSQHAHPSFTVVSWSVIILLILFIITIIILLHTSTVLHILLLSYVRDVCTV